LGYIAPSSQEAITGYIAPSSSGGYYWIHLLLQEAITYIVPSSSGGYYWTHSTFFFRRLLDTLHLLLQEAVTYIAPSSSGGCYIATVILVIVSLRVELEVCYSSHSSSDVCLAYHGFCVGSIQ